MDAEKSNTRPASVVKGPFNPYSCALPSSNSGIVLAMFRWRYRLQQIYTSLMLGLLGRLLQASSQRDAYIRREVTELPEDFTFSLGLWPDTDGFVLAKRETRFWWLRRKERRKPSLAVRFKHVSLAFSVVSFQQGTAEAFTGDHIVADGEITEALRIVRCLDRMLPTVLPNFIARRMVKRMPRIGFFEKLVTATLVYLQMIANLFVGR